MDKNLKFPGKISQSALISVCLFPGLLIGANISGSTPNIIYILADDLGYGDLGCYGQQLIQTPVLDKMASEGIRFTNHYAGSTVSAPSRCSLITGLHQGQASVRGNIENTLKENDYSIAQVLKQSGYATAMIGKWGLGLSGSTGDPHNKGFDYYFGYLCQIHAHNHYPDYLIKNGERIALNNKVITYKPGYIKTDYEFGSVATERNEYSHDLLINETIGFIEKNQSKPFFIYLPVIIPHANNEFDALPGNEHGMEVPDYGQYTNMNWPAAEKGKAAMISYLDKSIGTINEYLKANGLWENTIIIFTSDNGPHKEGGVNPDFFKSSGGLKGTKRNLYEGGIRVPMIVQWPAKIKRSSVCDIPSAFWDMMPTFADIAGVKLMAPTNGVSLYPTFSGNSGKQKKHEYLYWEFNEVKPVAEQQAVRSGNWKLIYFPLKNKFELFNLRTDKEETTDLAAKYPGIVKRLTGYMVQAHKTDPVYKLYKELTLN